MQVLPTVVATTKC